MPRWLVLLLSLVLQAAHALEVRDDLGHTTSVDRAPQRIVSLLPSLTEVVCALGACARLVGVDDFSDYPARVRGLPHLGGLEDVRVESVVALKPDLVLVPTSSRALERLQALGLKVLALEPRTFADVQRTLALLAPVLGAGDAQAVWRETQASVAAAARELPAAQRGARVYFEVSTAPYAASESSFIGEVLARLGLRNIVPGALGPFPKLNPEFVVRADPDFILLADDEAGAPLATRPGWQRLRALRQGHWCNFSRAQANVLARPGPRMGEGARLIVRCLRGELAGPAR